MTRILALAAVVASMSLVSCKTHPAKDDCASCCSTPAKKCCDAAGTKDCCSVKKK